MHIEDALVECAERFALLEREILTFTPRSLEDYRAEREAMFKHLANLNPNLTAEDLQRHVDGQYSVLSSPRFQLQNAFFNRWAAAYVTLVTVSHALCEAAINASLAILLAGKELAHGFAFIERAGLKRKWVEAPKLIKADYELAQDSPLCSDLKLLIKERNAIMHSKITLTYNGRQVLQGEEALISLDRAAGDVLWRFAGLPYSLMDHLGQQMRDTDYFFGIRSLLHRQAPQRPQENATLRGAL